MSVPLLMTAIALMGAVGKDQDPRPDATEKKQQGGQETTEGNSADASQDEPDPISGKDDLVRRYLEQRFKEAKRLFADQQYYRAFRLADALLIVAPDVPFRRDLKRFRRRAESRHLAQSVLTATFELDEEICTFPTESIRGALVLENVSNKPVVVGEEGRRGILGQALFRVTEVFGDGGEISSNGTRVLRIEEGFELEGGERHSIPIEIEIPRAPGMPILQIIRLRGTVRPSLLKLDDQEVARQIPWDESRNVLLPEELLGVAAEPYKQLQLSLLSRDLPRLVVALHLWRHRLEEEGSLATASRERTIDLLIASLRNPDDRVLHPLIVRELHLLTGERRAATVKSWLLYASERDRKRAAKRTP